MENPGNRGELCWLPVSVPFARHPGVQDHGEIANPVSIGIHFVAVIIGFWRGNFSDPDVLINRLEQDLCVCPIIFLFLHTSQPTLSAHIDPFQVVLIA
jgi:hypothetical protein